MLSRDRGYRLLRRNRVSLPGQVYFLTTNTNERNPLFRRFDLARIVVQTMRDLEVAGHVRSLAYVVMPDHLHWLIILRSQSLERVVWKLKGASARRINQRRKNAAQVWQAGFHDHALRSDEELRSVARYIVMNPVRAGLVSRVSDYPLWDAIWVGNGENLRG